MLWKSLRFAGAMTGRLLAIAGQWEVQVLSARLMAVVREVTEQWQHEPPVWVGVADVVKACGLLCRAPSQDAKAGIASSKAAITKKPLAILTSIVVRYLPMT